jgi:uncharacterized protein (DUF433 family)
VSVETLLAYLGAGDNIDDILSAHPQLEREDVLASIEYARCKNPRTCSQRHRG